MDAPHRPAPTLHDEPTADDVPARATLSDPTAPAAMAAAGPIATPAEASRNRRKLVLAAAVGVPALLVGVAIAAQQPLVRFLVERRAASLGVELDFDELDASFGSVRLGHARARLAGVKGIRVALEDVTIATSWLSVASVEARGVSVSIEGPATDRVLELAAWSSDHEATYRVPGSAKDVRLEWRAEPDAPAWLAMTGGSVTSDGKLTELTAATTAFGVPVGNVGASVAVDASGVTLEAGKRQGSPALVTASLHTNARPPALAIALRPVQATALASALGIALPGHAGVVSGRADLALGRGAITGTASVELDGWVPPHPKVLDAIVYGKKTTLKSRVTLAEDRATVKLDDLEVHAGKLALKGSGTIAEENRRPMLRAEVGGPIPCSELAREKASNELPGLLGELAGEVAGHAVSGTAKVDVSVEGDVRNLAAAKVTPKVAVGCQVRLPGL